MKTVRDVVLSDMTVAPFNIRLNKSRKFLRVRCVGFKLNQVNAGTTLNIIVGMVTVSNPCALVFPVGRSQSGMTQHFSAGIGLALTAQRLVNNATDTALILSDAAEAQSGPLPPVCWATDLTLSIAAAEVAFGAGDTVTEIRVQVEEFDEE